MIKKPLRFQAVYPARILRGLFVGFGRCNIRASGQFKTSPGAKHVKKKSLFDFFSVLSRGSTYYWSRAAEATAACGGSREPEQGPPSEFTSAAQGAMEIQVTATRTSPGRSGEGMEFPEEVGRGKSKFPALLLWVCEADCISVKNRSCKKGKLLPCGNKQLKSVFCNGLQGGGITEEKCC